MNSIEPMDQPTIVRNSTPPPKPGAQTVEPDADSANLHVYGKEKSAYRLSLATPDFQAAMKHATRLEGKGIDILVLDPTSPEKVYAKSNRNHDVDVGRIIRPEIKDGKYIRGPGEQVLPSFFAKLPREIPAVEDPAWKAQMEAVKNVTSDINDALGYRTKTTAANKQSAEIEVTQDPQKAILKKNGFALPDTILVAYKILDGKYHDIESNSLRFQDHGKRLSTPVEDRTVIKDMIAVAAAKNWGQLELKGTDTFRQLAWLEAESRGIQTKGYKPNERDLEQLAQLKQERGVQGPAVTDKGERVAAEGAKELVRAASISLGAAYSDNYNASAAENAQARHLEESAYKKLATVDIRRAQSLVAAERATTVNDGQLHTSIRFDAAKHQAASQNTDKAAAEPSKEPKVPNQVLAVTRVLSPDEQMRTDVASRVLEKALQKYPEHMRKDILAKVTQAVDKGDLKLPAPTVAERTVDKKPAPSPSMDRSR